MASNDALRGESYRRMVWLDGYRGIAVVTMVWVHVANTLLKPEEQTAEWYEQLTFFHGLVAPAFFWIGGFVRGVRVPTSGGKVPGFGVVKRLLGVMMLGYLLHFPWGALIHLDWDKAAVREMMKVDVLQVLAFTGLLMVGVERFVVGLQRQRFVIGALAVVFVVLEDWAGQWVTSWSFLNAWFSRETGSVFCLFPWVGFGLAGWLCGSCVAALRDRGVYLYAGVGALLAWGNPPSLGHGEAFFLQRLGWVILGAITVSWVFLVQRGRGKRLYGTLLLAGRESLVIYVVHLMMIHAIPLPFGTLDIGLGKTQSVMQVIGWFVLIAALSFGAALWNKWRKERSKRLEGMVG